MLPLSPATCKTPTPRFVCKYRSNTECEHHRTSTLTLKGRFSRVTLNQANPKICHLPLCVSRAWLKGADFNLFWAGWFISIYRSSSLQFEFNPFTYWALMEEGVEAAGHLWLSPTSIHIPDITRTVGALCTELEHTRINSIAKKFSHLRRAIIENHSADGNKGRRCGKYRFLQNTILLLSGHRRNQEVCIVFQGQCLLLEINNVNNWYFIGGKKSFRCGKKVGTRSEIEYNKETYKSQNRLSFFKLVSYNKKGKTSSQLSPLNGVARSVLEYPSGPQEGGGKHRRQIASSSQGLRREFWCRQL